MATVLRVERIGADRVSETGVFGRLYVDGREVGVTCEQPWRDNQKGRSCVPEGDYELRPWNSKRYGRVVVLVNSALQVYATEAEIPREQRGIARSACLIHAANWPHELQGCIAVGRQLAHLLPHGPGITESRATLQRLRSLWGDRRGLRLAIRWVP